ncbi:MAG TPA: DUF4292 domain-containing protein [Bacteroidales bacterium]|nr:DUF4292 domain-containing protein [Bacteroidales bacterium]
MKCQQVMKVLFGTVFVVVLATVLTGCHTSKEITRKVATNDVRKLESMLHQTIPFKTMDSKVEFKFNPKQGVGASMKGTIRMSKDSCILISIQPFAGFEAVKCLIVQDSIVLVSRLHKVYAVEKLSQFAYKDYVNISALQDLLTNRIFVPGDQNPNERKIARFDRFHQKEIEGYRWAENSYILDFILNKENQYTTLKAYRPEWSQQVMVHYSLFSAENDVDFPHVLGFSTEGFKVNYNLQIQYLKPQFNTTTDFRFDIPASYKRVTSTELIKRFQDLI